jgi:hypothetical protein
MNKTTIIQVPVEKKVRDQVEREAKKQGFSSIQDLVRLFFTQVINKQVAVRFEEPPVRLSKKAAARYDRMTKDFEEGKVISKKYSSAKEFMDDLKNA